MDRRPGDERGVLSRCIPKRRGEVWDAPRPQPTPPWMEMVGVPEGRRHRGLTFSSQLDIPQHGSTCWEGRMCSCHTSAKNGPISASVLLSHDYSLISLLLASRSLFWKLLVFSKLWRSGTSFLWVKNRRTNLSAEERKARVCSSSRLLAEVHQI